ncbi:AMP-binding protein [bacterium SCSIO 12827]|nr:AMP-binding protein [bacterium SCSIO 12827]
MPDNPHYDDQETRTAEAREATLFEALRARLAQAKAKAPYYREVLSDIDPAGIIDRAALAKLPVTRKSELVDRQAPGHTLGGLTTVPDGRLRHIYQSPGPTYDADGQGADWWRMARGLYAAGMRAGDVLHNSFSYHLTPAGLMVDSGAQAINCAVVPAGVGNTELQVRAIEHIRPTAYCGTPSFLKLLLDKAAETGADVSSLAKAAVGGEPFLPDQRAACAAAGIDAYNIYASADIGLIAYESTAREGLVLEEGLILEIVTPGTGEPVEPGQVGEVLLTTPFNADYPLIRFATGDMSAVMAGVSPCGRTNTRIKGWMGRADQAAKVKGMFIHPRQIADILKRHPEIARARMVVDRRDGTDVMTLMCETTPPAPDALAAALADTIQATCKLKGGVEFVPPGSLPNDGKVIDDRRGAAA